MCLALRVTYNAKLNIIQPIYNTDNSMTLQAGESQGLLVPFCIFYDIMNPIKLRYYKYT